MKKSREIKVIKRYILQILFCRKRNFLPLFQAFEIYYHDMQKVWRRCWKNPLKTKPKTCHSNCIVYVCKKPSIRNVCLTQILISVLQRIVFHVSVPSIIMWTKLGFYLLHALSFFPYYRYHNLATATTHDQIKFILTTPVSHLQNGFRIFSYHHRYIWYLCWWVKPRETAYIKTLVILCMS